MTYKLGDMILIEWDDIVSNASWQTSEEQDKTGPELVKTVGFFLKTYTYRKKKALRMAHSLIADGTGDTTNIPYGVIRKITLLKEVD